MPAATTNAVTASHRWHEPSWVCPTGHARPRLRPRHQRSTSSSRRFQLRRWCSSRRRERCTCRQLFRRTSCQRSTCSWGFRTRRCSSNTTHLSASSRRRWVVWRRCWGLCLQRRHPSSICSTSSSISSARHRVWPLRCSYVHTCSSLSRTCCHPSIWWASHFHTCRPYSISSPCSNTPQLWHSSNHRRRHPTTPGHVSTRSSSWFQLCSCSHGSSRGGRRHHPC
jgi:hypothetical protein